MAEREVRQKESSFYRHCCLPLQLGSKNSLLFGKPSSCIFDAIPQWLAPFTFSSTLLQQLTISLIFPFIGLGLRNRSATSWHMAYKLIPTFNTKLFCLASFSLLVQFYHFHLYDDYLWFYFLREIYKPSKPKPKQNNKVNKRFF